MSSQVAAHVVMVGGGVAGLACAWRLGEEASRREFPVEITVLEAGSRVGGTIVTETVEGCLVEGGPDCFLTDKPGALELISDLGLQSELSPTDDSRRRTYVLWQGRLRPLPDGLVLLVPTRLWPFVTSDLFSLGGKARMALDLVLPRGKDTDDETLGDFIRRRLGAEALEKLGEPLVAGIHSGDPETMSVRATFPRFLDMEREDRSLIVAMLRRMRAASRMRTAGNGAGTIPRTAFMTLRAGLGSLTEELRRRVGTDRVLTGQRVVEVRSGAGRGPQDEAGRNGAGPAASCHSDYRGPARWEVVTAESRVFPADAVVLASPSHEAAGMLRPISRSISSGLADELEAIPYVSSATVTLAYPAARFPRQPDGFGVVVPKGEESDIKAFTWVTSKFFGRAPAEIVLIRTFVRAGAGEVLLLGDEELAETARRELARILHIGASPLWWRVYRWPLAMPQYVVGHLNRIDRIERELERLPGLLLAGSAYRGTGIPDTVSYSRRCAQEVIDYLRGLTP